MNLLFTTTIGTVYNSEIKLSSMKYQTDFFANYNDI